MVGWADGQLWWQRELPGVAIERLYLIDERPVRGPAATDERPVQSPAVAAERLVIVGEDQRVWVTDVTFGRPLRRVETGVAAPQRVEVVGGTVVVWGLESAVGIDAGTLEPLWRQAAAPIVDTAVVQVAPAAGGGAAAGTPRWIATRAHGRSEWRLLDARTGQPVFEVALGEFDAVSAAVVDSERLLIAGWSGPPGEEGTQRRVFLSALGLSAGERLWSREFPAAVALNATQLAAHPALIPVLSGGAGGGSTADESPAIRLVRKRDGELGEALSIQADFRPAVEATCEMYMLVTPTRMIVQAGGNLIAYGNSPLQSGP
jgi:hypothetical protein